MILKQSICLPLSLHAVVVVGKAMGKKLPS